MQFCAMGYAGPRWEVKVGERSGQEAGQAGGKVGPRGPRVLGSTTERLVGGFPGVSRAPVIGVCMEGFQDSACDLALGSGSLSNGESSR
jgi:hypothetical protein